MIDEDFESHGRIMNADGSGQAEFPGGIGADWSPDSSKLVFGNWTINADGTGQMQLASGAVNRPPGCPTVPASCSSVRGWRDRSCTPTFGGSTPTGTGETLLFPAPDAAMFRMDLQPLPGSSSLPPYPAPKFASTVKAALVPVFRNPVNASHSPPLAAGSCTPPKPGSVAHFGPQSLGFAQLAVIYGDVTPGLIKENKATVLQNFRFRLNDSGVNGIRGDSDDKIFSTQGVFIP